MVKLFLILSLLIAIPAQAETPLQVVTRVRAKYPNLPGNRTITNQALREIISDPAVKGSLYKKTTGNNCLNYSCDKICYANNTQMYDVFGSWETTATPSWLRVTKFDSKLVE